MENNQKGNLKTILDRIEKDTKKECRSIILEAEIKAKEVEEEILKELDEKKAKLMEKYKKWVEAEKLRLISESKNKLLKERSVRKNQLVEGVVVKGLELAKKELNEKTIKKWVEAGLKKTGIKEVVITIPMKFKKLKLPYKKILTKETDDVTIENKDGTIRIVESLERKLNENKNLILVEISKILFS